MARKSMNDKVVERFKRIQQDRREKDRNRYDKSYQPEHPDNQ